MGAIGSPLGDDFHRLVHDLNRFLGPSSGIGSDDVDSDQLQCLMKEYCSNECDWARYAFQDGSRSYTRNLVDKGNGKSNLLILVWTPGQGSLIHDHANAHCIMKVLKGRLKETLYSWPDQARIDKDEMAPPRVQKEAEFMTDDVTYMSDTLGLHKVSNPDPKGFAVSLHLYTPPNAAMYGCQIFNEESGRSSHIKLCNYYSDRGQKL